MHPIRSTPRNSTPHHDRIKHIAQRPGDANADLFQALEQNQRLVAARSLVLPAWLREAEELDAFIDGCDSVAEHQFNESDIALNGRRYAGRRRAMIALDALGQAALKSKRRNDVDAVHDLVSFLGACTYRTAHFGTNEIVSSCVFLPPPCEFANQKSSHDLSKTACFIATDLGRDREDRQYGFGVSHDGALIAEIVPRSTWCSTNASDAIRSAPSHAAVWKILDTIGQWQVSQSSAIISPLPRSVAVLGAAPRNPYTRDWTATLSELLRTRRRNIEQLGFSYRRVKRWATQILHANLSVHIFRELHSSIDRRVLTAMCHSPAVLSVNDYNVLCNVSTANRAAVSWQLTFDEFSSRIGSPTLWQGVADQTSAGPEPSRNTAPDTIDAAVSAVSAVFLPSCGEVVPRKRLDARFEARL